MSKRKQPRWKKRTPPSVTPAQGTATPPDAGRTATEPAPPANGPAAELDAALRMAEANRPEPPPAPEPAPDAGAAAGAGEDELIAKADAFVRLSESGQDTESAALLASVTEEDVQDFIKLIFGLIAYRRGDHWEMSDKEAARIAHWVRKSIERHGVEWVAKWLPDIMAGALLGYAILRRMDIDKKLKQQKKDATAGKGAADATGKTAA